MPLPPLNPLAIQHEELVTDLSPKECAARIREARSSWKTIWLEPSGSNPSWYVRGSVKPDKFRLFIEDFRSMTFRPIARGRFIPIYDGTKIVVDFGLHETTVIFVFLCSLLPLIGSTLAAFQMGRIGLELVLSLVAVPAIIAVFYVIALMAWRNAAKQIDYMVRYLREVVSAKQ